MERASLQHSVLDHGIFGFDPWLLDRVGDLPRGTRSLSGDGKSGAENPTVLVCAGASKGRCRAVERSAFAGRGHGAAGGAGATTGAGDFDCGAGRGVRVLLHTIREKFARHIAGIRIVHRRTRDLPNVHSFAGTSFLGLRLFRVLFGCAEFMVVTSIVVPPASPSQRQLSSAPAIQ